MPTFEQILIFCDYNIDFGFVPEVIFDLGANIGLATVFFKNKYPDASIICVEPEISNFYLLKKNVERYSNIHFYNNGIWNKKTNLVIEDTNRGNWGFTVRETVTNNVNSISAITIDEIMNQLNINSIDVLKIDIEGSEKELFELNYQTWLPKVKVILIELHDYIREGAAKSFFSALVHNDFSMTHRGENIICFMR